MTFWIEEVVDEHGGVLMLGHRLGGGGQGEVRRVTNHPGLAVKLLWEEPELRVDEVRRLPLADIPIAAPTLLLGGTTPGYVMRLADDMTSLRALAPPEFGVKHDARWYRDTGGLRRRLTLAARTADVLARLHGRSLVYVDLNPNNVMISSDPLQAEAWLIDADNLTLASKAASGLGFPRYFAPERWAGGERPSPESDRHSLAVLLFTLLAKVHPFEGVAATDLPGEEAQGAIDSGRLPFIDHPTDDRNRVHAGIPRQLTLSPRLRELAQQAFVAGLHLPTQRPTAAQWRDRLLDARRHVIECMRCGWTYYREERGCPVCEEPAPPLVGIALHSALESERVIRTGIAQLGRTRHLTTWDVWGVGPIDERAVSVRPEQDYVQVGWVRGTTVEILQPRQDNASGRQPVRVPLRTDKDVRLTVSSDQRPSRVIDLGWIDP